MVSPSEVVSFWVDEVGPKGWYIQDDKLDATIRDRFMETWDVLAHADCEGKALDSWFESP